MLSNPLDVLSRMVFAVTLCHPPAVLNVSLIVSCVNLVSLATWGTFSSTVCGRDQTYGLVQHTLINFPKHFCQLTPFTFVQACETTRLLLSDTKLIALKRDIYCYFTNLDLLHLIYQNKLNLQFLRWPPGGDMCLWYML